MGSCAVEADFAANTYNDPAPLSVPGATEKDYMQTLIPERRQLEQLVGYHEAHLLWYHGCIQGSTFRVELNKAMNNSSGLQIRDLDLRWCALLFSIITSSMTCTSDSLALSWGFPSPQKRLLSQQWYEATLQCLQLGDYTSKSHIHSIQAIQVLSMSAHLIGSSNKQFIMSGAALRISQKLGLQRLSYDSEIGEIPTNNEELSQSRKDVVIRRETGRRMWMQLCIQDWFSIPCSEMYSINKQHFTTIKPQRLDDEIMTLVGEKIPSISDFGCFLYDVASVMADFHDSFTALGSLAEKYEQVLKYDSKLRALGTGPSCQAFLHDPNETRSQPPWARWVKEAASIVHAHKIIMVHRSFLGKSFTDSKYLYTRWASIEASKRILREVETASSIVDRPVLWNEQV